MPLLAVYGTLMRGQPNQLPAEVRAAMTHVGDCLIPGAIHRVVTVHEGAPFEHPALVRSRAGMVRGELVEAPASVLPALDAYEDFRRRDPAGSMYLRRLLQVWRVDRTEHVRAWVYVWNRPVAGLERIASGDWRAAVG